jgi:hypothetical protein
MHARVAGKLPLQISRKSRVELKQKQLRIGRHPASDLARVHPFARPVLSDNTRLAEIDFARHLFHKRL